MILAQLNTVDPRHLMDVMVIIVVGLGAAVNIVALMRTGASQKREVTLSAEFATRTQVQEVKSAADAAVQSTRSEIAELKEALTRIHERIDDMERELGAVPDRVIAQLVNTMNLFDRRKS